MTSSSLLKIALSYWDAESRGDLPAVLEHFHSDATFTAPGCQFRGRGEIAAFYRKIMGTYKAMRIEARRTIESGSDIVVEFGFHYTRQDGSQGYAEGCNVFTIAGGQFTRFRAYFNPSDY